MLEARLNCDKYAPELCLRCVRSMLEARPNYACGASELCLRCGTSEVFLRRVGTLSVCSSLLSGGRIAPEVWGERLNYEWEPRSLLVCSQGCALTVSVFVGLANCCLCYSRICSRSSTTKWKWRLAVLYVLCVRVLVACVYHSRASLCVFVCVVCVPVCVLYVDVCVCV